MSFKKLFYAFLAGIIGIFAFAPFSLKFLIFVSYAYLIYILIHNKPTQIKEVFAWGFGHWGFGMSWIIVSVYYYGESSIALSMAIFILLVIILSIVFTCPLLFIRHILNNLDITKNYQKILVITSLLIIGEFSRYHLLNGVPWLIPGNIFLDTITQNIYPLFGASASSIVIYILCCSLAIFLNENKNYLIIIILIIISIIPNYKPIEEIEDGIMVSIIQPSSDPFLKYKKDYRTQIEMNLLDLINTSSELSEIVVLPEAELPYPIRSTQFEQFINKIKNSEKIVMGAWDIDRNSVYNSIYGLKTYNSYKKIHLVPFGEYIPFISSLRGLVAFFDLPMSNVKHGPKNQQNIRILNNIAVSTPICFDIAFANTVRIMNKSSLLMINVSNDTWFGNSIGPYQHLNIARIRSIENKRWTIRSTNDGISAIINSNGTIVDKLEKGSSGVLEGEVELINNNTLYNSYGYLFTYFFSFIILIMASFTKIWKKSHTN